MDKLAMKRGILDQKTKKKGISRMKFTTTWMQD